MNIVHEPRKGYSFIVEGGDIDELAQELNRSMLPHIPQPMEVPKVRGAVKAFWFSWSNGQAAWDAVAWKDFPWHLDGSGFFVFLGKNALSPLKKLWSATEMNYVARKLTNHPGYYGSPESSSPKRRWAVTRSKYPLTKQADLEVQKNLGEWLEVARMNASPDQNVTSWRIRYLQNEQDYLSNCVKFLIPALETLMGSVGRFANYAGFPAGDVDTYKREFQDDLELAKDALSYVYDRGLGGPWRRRDVNSACEGDGEDGGAACQEGEAVRKLLELQRTLKVGNSRVAARWITRKANVSLPIKDVRYAEAAYNGGGTVMVEITLALDTTEHLDEKLVEQWIRENWNQIRSKFPRISQPKKPSYSDALERQMEYQDDDIEDFDDIQDDGMPRLDPRHMSFYDVKWDSFDQWGKQLKALGYATKGGSHFAAMAEDPDFVPFGNVARRQIGEQAQYASRYVKGTHGYPNLGAGLRFLHGQDYHDLQIHKDDVEEFVHRVLEHMKATGQR